MGFLMIGIQFGTFSVSISLNILSSLLPPPFSFPGLQSHACYTANLFPQIMGVCLYYSFSQQFFLCCSIWIVLLLSSSSPRLSSRELHLLLSPSSIFLNIDITFWGFYISIQLFFFNIFHSSPHYVCFFYLFLMHIYNDI